VEHDKCFDSTVFVPWKALRNAKNSFLLFGMGLWELLQRLETIVTIVFAQSIPHCTMNGHPTGYSSKEFLTSGMKSKLTMLVIPPSSLKPAITGDRYWMGSGRRPRSWEASLFPFFATCNAD
jgi:hypothetical protein